MQIGQLNINVDRKAIKNLHLSVYPPDGHVHVSAPVEVSDELIRLYVLEKMPWIMEKISILTSFKIQPPRKFVSGETHFFLGTKRKLYVHRENNSTPFSVARKGDSINIVVHKDTKPERIEQLLNDWYKSELTPIIEDFISKWSNIIGIAPNEWAIQQMSKRWGSCTSAKRKILFNLQLAKKPSICIEYVVAHEMLHLIERTHNAHFARLLDTYFPNWEMIKKDLNEFPL